MWVEPRIALRPSDGGRFYLWKMEDGRRKMSGRPEGFTMFALRAWLWLVPIGILVAAAVFAALAAMDKRWALMAVMIAMGVFGLGLLVFHVWLMHRLRQPSGGDR